MSYSSNVHSKKGTSAKRQRRRFVKRKRDEAKGRHKTFNIQFGGTPHNTPVPAEEVGVVNMIGSALGGVFGKKKRGLKRSRKFSRGS